MAMAPKDGKAALMSKRPPLSFPVLVNGHTHYTGALGVVGVAGGSDA